MASPTQRTLAALREDGWLAQVVEKWVPQARRRVDLFGVGDVIAIKGKETLLVQATSQSNAASRVAKIQASDTVPVILEANWRLEVWGWKKYKCPTDGKYWQVTKYVIKEG